MSKISFDSGDYNTQVNMGRTQNGLLYFNPTNRDISIGGSDAFTHFNDIMVNDNNQLDNLDNYTYSSQYMKDNYCVIDNNSQNYYSVNKAQNIIGTTNDTMTDGYIKQQLSTLINGIPYEAQFNYSLLHHYNIHPSWMYTQYELETIKTYTIFYPSQLVDKPFKMVIVFAYTTDNNNHIQLQPMIKLLSNEESESAQDVQIRFRATLVVDDLSIVYDDTNYPNVPNTIYKAFWV